MAIKWIEGFEGFGVTDGNAVSGLSIKYGSSGADSNFTLRAGRTGGHCIELSNTINNNTFTTPSLGTITTIIVGFAIKSAAYNALPDILTILDGATTHITLRLLNSGEWRVLRAGVTQLGSDTSGAAVSAGTWSYVELKVTISDASGVVVLKVNGTEYLNLTSQDTRNGGNASCDRIKFIGSTNANDDTTLDDIYVLDAGSSPNNDFLGSQKVIGIFPEVDGDSEQFTKSTGSDSFALVDDNPHNGDTDYIESGTSGQMDLWGYAAASGIQSIKGIQINSVCRETDANPFSLKQPCKSGSTISEGSAVAIGSTSYRTINRIMETDPDTSAAWTVSSLNAAQFGVKVN